MPQHREHDSAGLNIDLHPLGIRQGSETRVTKAWDLDDCDILMPLKCTIGRQGIIQRPYLETPTTSTSREHRGSRPRDAIARTSCLPLHCILLCAHWKPDLSVKSSLHLGFLIFAVTYSSPPAKIRKRELKRVLLQTRTSHSDADAPVPCHFFNPHRRAIC